MSNTPAILRELLVEMANKLKAFRASYENAVVKINYSMKQEEITRAEAYNDTLYIKINVVRLIDEELAEIWRKYYDNE